MKVGEFAKWEAEDFSYVGRIKAIDADRCTLVTADFEVGFPLSDGTLTPARKPKGVEAVVIEAPKKTKAVKVATSATKLEQAIELVRAYKDANGELPTRAMGIKMIVETLNMTAAGAATYFNTARKVV